MLPNKFRPYKCKNLVRLGNNFDGGYIVNLDSICQTDYLISIGISDDWSFENDFRKINKSSIIYLFDDALNYFFVIRNFIREIIFIFNRKSIILLKQKFSNLFDYFSINSKFFFKREFINQKSFSEKIKEKKKIFLKIDIEGNEYSILSEILKHQKNIISLVIEFHNCGKNLNKILNFIDNFDLNIIHLHGNNFSQINSSGFPDTLEFTFLKLDTNKEFSILPNKLDCPNDLRTDDFELKFK